MAQRVCAIPACESKTLLISGFVSAMSSLSLATLPTSLNAKTSFFLSPSTQRPAESYPLYSKRERPDGEQCQPYIRPVGLQMAQEWDSRVGRLAVDKGVENILSVLLDQVIDVTKNATGGDMPSVSTTEARSAFWRKKRTTCLLNNKDRERAVFLVGEGWGG